MTIPNNPNDLKKLEALADRNIANGDWGDEVTFPGETVPISPEEREAKNFVAKNLAKVRAKRLKKR